MLKKSFSPIVGKDPEVLILGSLPGDLSLELNEYYAHPRNRFWRLMFKIFNEDYSDNYVDKVNLIKQNNTVLWDVSFSAIREGSLDSKMKNEIPNLILPLLEKHKTINRILFNGKKTEQLFMKHFEKNKTIRYFSLPSTSPANAKYSIDDLMKVWKEAMFL